MSKKKILYIGNKLSKKGNTVTSIETLGSFLNQEGYNVVTVSSKSNRVLRMLDMCVSTIKYRNKVSIVLIDTYSTQNFLYAVAVGSLCRTFKIPYVLILRGGNLESRLEKSKKLSAKLFNGAKTNVVPSAFLLHKFHEKGFNNLTYIPNTIEIKKYPFKLRKEIRARLLWVRSFAEIYNPTLAVEIVKQLQSEGIYVSLCMVGPDKDGSLLKCRRMAEKFNLPISFTGLLSKEEWISISKDFDIFINTTNFDNMPVSVMEAMALGLPVISTNVGGVPFLISDRKDGILVSPDNSLQFIDAIKYLINNPVESHIITTNARTKVESFDWDNVKHSWFKLLDA